MSFLIDNYSVLHSYNYKGKSNLSKCLDWASSPWRELFGAENVCFLSGARITGDKKSSILKITALFLLTVAFPMPGGLVASISLASFVFKVVFAKYSGEQSNAVLELQKSDVICEFERAKEIGCFERSLINLFTKHSFLRESVDNQQAYAKAIVKDINEPSSKALDKAADRLVLISDTKIISDAITAIYCKYLEEYSRKVGIIEVSYHTCFDYSFKTLEDFIRRALIEKPEEVVNSVIKDCCLVILEKQKIEKEISLEKCYCDDLTKIFIIEDALASLQKVEKEADSVYKDKRSQAFALVEGFDPDFQRFRVFVKANLDLKIQQAILDNIKKNPYS